jgi:hypothetical protein
MQNFESITVHEYYTVDQIIEAYVPITKIIDNLFLGNILAFNSPKIFSDLKIKHVIALRWIDPRILKTFKQANPDSNIYCFNLRHKDFEQNTDKLKRAITDILNIVDGAGVSNVYIGCRSGLHRSVGIMCRVLMSKLDVSSSQAFELIKSKRSIADNIFCPKDSSN